MMMAHRRGDTWIEYHKAQQTDREVWDAVAPAVFQALDALRSDSEARGRKLLGAAEGTILLRLSLKKSKLERLETEGATGKKQAAQVLKALRDLGRLDASSR